MQPPDRRANAWIAMQHLSESFQKDAVVDLKDARGIQKDVEQAEELNPVFDIEDIGLE